MMVVAPSASRTRHTFSAPTPLAGSTWTPTRCIRARPANCGTLRSPVAETGGESPPGASAFRTSTARPTDGIRDDPRELSHDTDDIDLATPASRDRPADPSATTGSGHIAPT